MLFKTGMTIMVSFIAGVGAFVLDTVFSRRVPQVKECVVCHRTYPAMAVYCARDASLLRFREGTLPYIREQGVNESIIERLPELQAMSHKHDGE